MSKACNIRNLQFSYCVILTLFTSFSLASRPTPPQAPKHEKFFSSPNRELHGKFITGAMDIILDYCGLFNLRKEWEKAPYKPLSVSELKAQFPFELSKPTDDEELVGLIKKICQLSPKAAHHFMLSKRQGHLDYYAVAGDWMAATMSNLVVTYQVAPVWTLMEIKLTETLSHFMGWEHADGISTTGGGAANSIAVSLGIAHKTPTYKSHGFWTKDEHQKIPGIFVSAHASPSWEKAAIYQGIGLNNLIKVKPDLKGRMTLASLLEAINNNGHIKPVFVGATLGTPVFGAIDEIEKIGIWCNYHNVWFHIDADRGAGIIITQDFSNAMSRANSVTFGGWAWGAPYVSTMLLTKDPDILHKSIGLHASYVFTEFDLYDGKWDRGDHTIQTSRRPEIAKLWFLFRKHGTSHLNNLIVQTRVNANRMIDLMEPDPNFQLMIDTSENHLPIISFYYANPEHFHWLVNKKDRDAYISRVNVQIHKKLREDEKMEITLSKISDWYEPRDGITFLTMSLNNPNLRREDIIYIFETIKAAGRILDNEQGVEYPARPYLPESESQGYFDFMRNIIKDILFEKGLFFSRESPVSNFKQPMELLNVHNFLSLGHYGVSNEQIKEDFKKIIEFSPHWAHPYFIYQLAAGLDPYSLVADWVSSITNAPMLTYDDSPMFQIMEMEVAKQLRKIVFKSETGDGIITDGGSMANQIAMSLARHWKNSELRTGGHTVARKKLVGFMSAASHYSTTKSAIVQSMGHLSVVLVETDALGRMDMGHLERHIIDQQNKGAVPYFLVITTGTTILSSVDPIEPSIQLCRKYNLWCHIDGMFGGMSVMSPKYRNGLMRGIEGADSWAADLHKLFGSTMVCTMLLTKHPNRIAEALSVGNPEDFSFEPTDFGSPRGDRHWQYEKRNNILKFWLLWKAKGCSGMACHINRIMSNKDYIVQQLHSQHRKDQGFVPLLETHDLTNVCFYYVPKILHSHRPSSGHITDENVISWISKSSFAIEKDLLINRLISIVAQDLHGAVEGYTGVFLKAVMMGSSLSHQDIDYILDAIAYSGETAGTEAIQKAKNTKSEVRRKGTPLTNRFDPFGHMELDIREENLRANHL